MKAKKSFGQHFLINEAKAEAIVKAITELNPKNILEIGPGKGVLSKYLLDWNSNSVQKANIKFVDADEDMIQYLIQHFPQHKESFILADFLKLDLQSLFPHRSFSVIGNFPYNISSQIVFKMIDHRDQIDHMVGMFQREVAERIIANEGTKVYGILSVLIKAYFERELIFHVKPGNFNPPPKVQSSVIRLKRKKNVELPVSEKLFRQIVKLSFNQRRKMLRNSLKSLIVNNQLQSDQHFTKRPEQLSLEDYILITEKIEKQ